MALLAYCDETGEALAAILRPANAGSNTAADQIAVLERALEQIPPEQIEDIEILVRADTAGATHDLLDFCREGRLRYSVGYELTDQVRAAILRLPEARWIAALATDGSPRANGQVAEITEHLDLSSWPSGSRVIVGRERAHPGAQLTLTDHDGHRCQAVLTDQTQGDIGVLERRHRQRAHCEDHIRNDKDTPSTPAARSCTSTRAGAGHERSLTRSRASARSPHPPDRPLGPHDTRLRPAAKRRDQPLPPDGRRAAPNAAATHRSSPTPPPFGDIRHATGPTHSSPGGTSTARHLALPTARSGLERSPGPSHALRESILDRRPSGG
jgi:hypothetical protein